jgi:hypothetical protein
MIIMTMIAMVTASSWSDTVTTMNGDVRGVISNRARVLHDGHPLSVLHHGRVYVLQLSMVLVVLNIVLVLLGCVHQRQVKIV